MAQRDRGERRPSRARREDREPSDRDHSSSDSKKGRRALHNLRRELSEEELSTSGAQKMLLERLDRLEEENLELKEIEKEFHESDKDVAVLRERQSKSISRDIMLASGSLLLGLSPSFWAVQPTGVILVIIGGALVIASVVGPYGGRLFKRIGLR